MAKSIMNKVFHAIFQDPANGYLETVRTTSKGTFVPTGLSVSGKNTTIDITDTATLLPATALTARNALSVHNTDSQESIYVGFDNTVTADSVIGNTSGRQVGAGLALNFDITDNVSLYAIAESGKTVRVHIMELA